MRDKFKDQQYFNNFIAYEETRIEKTNKLRTESIDKRGEDDRGVKKSTISLFNFSLHTLIASYSVGKSIDTVRDLFPRVCHWFLQKENIFYDDTVKVISLSILLNSEEFLLKIKKRAIEENLIDKFMKFLFQDESLEISCQGFPAYAKIVNIANASDKTGIIKEYLSSWYLVNDGSYWHDSHKSENDTYFGYWCFESAAAVKLLNINPNIFYSYDYFPCDLL